MMLGCLNENLNMNEKQTVNLFKCHMDCMENIV